MYSTVLNMTSNGTRIISRCFFMFLFCLLDSFVCLFYVLLSTEALPLLNIYPSMHFTTEHHISIYTCVTPRNACQWRYCLQTHFRT